MNKIEGKLIPFVLGLCFGHYGVRWVIHLGYMAAIIGSFFIGKHFS